MYRGKFLLCATLVLLLVSFGCGRKEEPVEKVEKPAGGGGAEYNEAMATATIAGKTVLQGQAPPNAKLQMGADPVCQKQHSTPVFSEDVIANGDKLQNAFVYVKEGAEKWTFKPSSQPVVLDQQGCVYKPHVIGIQTDQSLKILNSDPLLHNIHPYAKVNQQWNIGMPTKGMAVEKKFSKPEVMIPVRCDVHKWMSSYIGVLPHPFYTVTGADGTFALKLPPGDYVIEAWHEKFGPKAEKVTVGDKETKDITFTFQSSETPAH